MLDCDFAYQLNSTCQAGQVKATQPLLSSTPEPFSHITLSIVPDLSFHSSPSSHFPSSRPLLFSTLIPTRLVLGTTGPTSAFQQQHHQQQQQHQHQQHSASTTRQRPCPTAPHSASLSTLPSSLALSLVSWGSSWDPFQLVLTPLSSPLLRHCSRVRTCQDKI